MAKWSSTTTKLLLLFLLTLRKWIKMLQDSLFWAVQLPLWLRVVSLKSQAWNSLEIRLKHTLLSSTQMASTKPCPATRNTSISSGLILQTSVLMLRFSSEAVLLVRLSQTQGNVLRATVSTTLFKFSLSQDNAANAQPTKQFALSKME